ncbi:MAG TPA: laccase domain-containing protein, partial [Rhodocyclaceae bacterium]|nr:laccase domain-containing protein [Rhodocyclaceae bacterium]
MNPSLSAPELLLPDWPAPQGVRALITTRRGGVSAAPYDSFNLGGRAGDDPACVAANRAALRKLLPSGPVWLQQVHGAHVVDADVLRDGSEAAQADAAVARSAGTV